MWSYIAQLHAPPPFLEASKFLDCFCYSCHVHILVIKFGLALGAATRRAASSGADKRGRGGRGEVIFEGCAGAGCCEREAGDVVRAGWPGWGARERRNSNTSAGVSAPRDIDGDAPLPAAARVVDLVLLLYTLGGRERELARVAEQGQGRGGALVGSRAMGMRWWW